jgi:hypothetical protein
VRSGCARDVAVPQLCWADDAAEWPTAYVERELWVLLIGSACVGIWCDIVMLHWLCIAYAFFAGRLVINVLGTVRVAIETVM